VGVTAGGGGSAERTVAGTVVELDDVVARVLIGPEDEEWFFPRNMLPPSTHVGSRLVFESREGRYEALEIATPSIEDRLARPLSLRRNGGRAANPPADGPDGDVT
jgi:hypothetical protein